MKSSKEKEAENEVENQGNLVVKQLSSFGNRNADNREIRTNSSNRAGRPSSLTQENLVRLLNAYYSRAYTFRQLADMFRVSRMTVWRAVMMYEPAESEGVPLCAKS